jgi:hypothetical protein
MYTGRPLPASILKIDLVVRGNNRDDPNQAGKAKGVRKVDAIGYSCWTLSVQAVPGCFADLLEMEIW